MALLIACPDCEAENRFPDANKDKLVACKTCGAAFKATAKARFVEDPNVDRKSSKDTDDEATKPKKRKSNRTDLDDDDEKPRRGKPRNRPNRGAAVEEEEEDDDDEKPRRGSSRNRRNRDDDDDEDDRDSRLGRNRRSSRGRGHTRVANDSSKVPVLIGAGIFAVIVVGLIIYAVISTGKKAEQIIKNTQENIAAAAKQNNNVPGGEQLPRFDQLLAKAKAEDRFALTDLQRENPNVPRRAEMAKALEEVLTSNNVLVAVDAANALRKWGGKENVPGILKALNSPRASEDLRFRETLLTLLGDFKDPRGTKAIVDIMLIRPENRTKATEVILKIGEPAEPELLRLLQDPDKELQLTGCRILKDIGTAASVPALELIVNANKLERDGKSRQLTQEANSAIKAIGLRKK